MFCCWTTGIFYDKPYYALANLISCSILFSPLLGEYFIVICLPSQSLSVQMFSLFLLCDCWYTSRFYHHAINAYNAINDGLERNYYSRRIYKINLQRLWDKSVCFLFQYFQVIFRSADCDQSWTVMQGPRWKLVHLV